MLGGSVGALGARAARLAKARIGWDWHRLQGSILLKIRPHTSDLGLGLLRAKALVLGPESRSKAESIHPGLSSDADAVTSDYPDAESLNGTWLGADVCQPLQRS